jgi:hypothetical protein
MIRLGRIKEWIALAEGWENALAWDALRRRGEFGDVIVGEDVSLAAAVDLGNLAGRSLGAVEHPALKDANGNPCRIVNGQPDPKQPGVVLPENMGIKGVILLADLDSETYATAGKLSENRRRPFRGARPRGQDRLARPWA